MSMDDNAIPNVSIRHAEAGGFEVWLLVEGDVTVVARRTRLGTESPIVIGDGPTELEALRDAEALLEEALSTIRVMQAGRRRGAG